MSVIPAARPTQTNGCCVALAPVPRPPPTPQVNVPPPHHSALDLLDDHDDDHEPPRPRLSMALEDMYEDDSFHEAPPRQSLLPDLPEDGDTATFHSPEFGRRALSEDPRAMFPSRISEHFGGDITELGIDGEDYEIDGTFINRRPSVNPNQLLGDEEDDTGEIQALTGRRDGRRSDMDLGVFGELDEPEEPTFRFTVPQRMRAPTPQPEEEEEEQAGVVQEYDDSDQGAEAVIYHQEDDYYQTQLDDEAATGHDAAGWESYHEEDPELQAYREEESAIDRSLFVDEPAQAERIQKKPKRQTKALNISRYGLEYPSFPSAVVKRIATGLNQAKGRKAKITGDTLAALTQTTDWFFEQISESAGAYAQHAGRKTIEEADMITLMKRYV